eukprot:TRINITY_DN287_c0_g2_i1.p1 TRINITY_DN287_c0_g2~~TRINITY_DN287_c0_g2_i1.p1  ORF type:complete len:319 (-),score=85.76 TRINITY_DN287_c0_g2_i1:384-1340(-)
MQSFLRNSFDSLGKKKIMGQNKKIGKYILTDNLLGQGSQSKVYEGIKIDTKERVAIKRINKKKLTNKSKKQLINEIKLLKKVSNSKGSDNFVKLLDAYDHKRDSTIDLIFELIEGGELYDLCVQYSNGVPESVAKPIFRQIVTALKQLHDLDIAHLDIKLENIMYNQETKKMKFVDFGFATETIEIDPITGEKNNKLLRNFAGSVHYASPEIITHCPYNGKYTDVYSLGILLYAFLIGRFPFDGDDKDSDSIFEKILDQEYEIPDWISKEAADLISSLITDIPESRLTADEILQHPFLQEDTVDDDDNSNNMICESFY